MTSQYSIKDLERISGIKAHTIRIWEKRYDLLNPERTDTNIRHYCNDDLKRILNISVLVNNGYKISKIARLDQDELGKKILELNNFDSPGQSGHIESLVVSMIDMDEAKFENVLNRAIFKLGFENTLFQVIYPLLQKVGILWQIGTINPFHEHFITNLVRQKIFAAVDALTTERGRNSKTYLLVLPQWELHDIGMLVYNYLVRKNGHNSIFLGQGVPLEDVEAISDILKPDALVTSLSTPVEEEDMTAYLRDLARIYPETPIFVSGIQLEKLQSRLPKNIQKFSSVIEFRDQIL